MEIKIRDLAFAHTDYSTLQKSKYFKWVSTGDKKNVCFFTDSCLNQVYHSNDTIKVAWLIEPRAISEASYDFIKKNWNAFDYILTYDKELLLLDKRFIFYPHGGCWIKDEDKKIYEKTKFCSIIASSKADTEGHKLRHKIIERHKEIDVFGNGYNFIENKVDGLRDYKFSIVVENSMQDDYFTEKIIDSIMCGCVPIYWGTKNINDYVNNIPTFNTTEELDVLLDRLKKDNYPEEYKKTNFDIAKKFTIPEDYIFENYNFLFT